MTQPTLEHSVLTPDTRAFVVLKFGGTSVANAHNWHRIAQHLRAARTAGEHPVMVCSAVAGVTDALARLVKNVVTKDSHHAVLADILALHEQLGTSLKVDASTILQADLDRLHQLATLGRANPSAKWQAAVMAMGELMSTKLVANWLESSGLCMQWIDAREVLCASPTHHDVDGDNHYLAAECRFDPSTALQQRLGAKHIDATITQGFIARNADNNTVLLGRGGSDTSAAYLAAILKAKRLEIWTDVPGMFTSDPRITENARLVPQLTYDEAAVLGSLGAKVLHPRCLAPVKATGIPLHIRCTQRPELAGTVITGQAGHDGVRAVTAREKLCLVIMRRPRRWQPIGFMARVAACFESHQLSMDLVSSSTSEIRATIDLAANPSASSQLADLMTDLSLVCEPELRPDVTCVSIVGTRISGALGHISSCLNLFSKPTIHLVTHAADDSHLSFVVDRALAPALAAAVHDTLFTSGTACASLGARWSSMQASIGNTKPIPSHLSRPDAYLEAAS